ncbi:hypothetical protein ABEB36_012233 [Hypothenemus hampei]|uniref:Secernin-3 n=1 Tax=Hypothenemus hampei TaxID=57062 RepID=A0ABD1EBB2_HYPHA
MEPCDCFVAVLQDEVIFGKNSNRPRDEVQEIIYIPTSEVSQATTKCTYLEVESVKETKAVILSKSNWTWGAEMGANECNVAIGNTPISIKDIGEDPKVERLLGVDLVRLGLERSSNADEALDVIVDLLDKYGQGGPACNNDSIGCFNSFIIADPKQAWILETCGKHWVAEKLTSGVRNVTNTPSITTKIDRKSEGIEKFAISKELWDGQGDFNFAKVFSASNLENRNATLKALLNQVSNSDNKFKVKNMMDLLRNKESDINKPYSEDQKFATTGSQVSVLSSKHPSVHWFTGLVEILWSVYKPFIFTNNATISKLTICPDKQSAHLLYARYRQFIDNPQHNQIKDVLKDLESQCILAVEEQIQNVGDDFSELDELFKDCVEAEIKFYR